jgi:hypothetical protein
MPVPGGRPLIVFTHHVSPKVAFEVASHRMDMVTARVVKLDEEDGMVG